MSRMSWFSGFEKNEGFKRTHEVIIMKWQVGFKEGHPTFAFSRWSTQQANTTVSNCRDGLANLA